MASDDLHLRLRGLMDPDRAVRDLRDYFGVGGAPGAVRYTGSRFESLGGGGDRPETADTVTAEDLIAVQTLSVRVPAPVALDLLEGELGVRMSELLRAIPAGLDMADAGTTHLAEGSPADAAWKLLREQPRIGWVTAGKLLARKRPRLLPVYDQVVRCVLGGPESVWLGLCAALQADERALHHALVELRQRAGLPEHISVLRVCDVVLWMRHRKEHRRTGCTAI
ncbi:MULTISPECIES: DUF6308 family protein [unclassified Streptomyces]|uniref:DUF6308 family protein n=1 Tax=unclassified Streptomyces TaxID=2593676 RepID=UPI0003624DEE|nr:MULTISPECIES: DUF6308 family protein [unclassified Streptomyces]EYT83619.1 hypothetical protein CF54_06260 [Streptomyces sp. Tu 6176]